MNEAQETKQADETYQKLFAHWTTRATALERNNSKLQRQRKILSVTSLDFDRTYTQLKSKLESELAARIPYLRFEELPMLLPDEAIIDLGCDGSAADDTFFTVEELFIFKCYSYR